MKTSTRKLDPAIAGSRRVDRDEVERKLGRVAALLIDRLWLVRDANGVTTITNEHLFAMSGHETIPKRTGQRALARLVVAGFVRQPKRFGRYDGADGEGGLGFQWLDPKKKTVRVFKRVVFGAPATPTLGGPKRVSMPPNVAAWVASASVFSHGGARSGTGVAGNQNAKGDGLEYAYRTGRRRRPFVPKGDGQVAPKDGQVAATPTRSSGDTISSLLLLEKKVSGEELRSSGASSGEPTPPESFPSFPESERGTPDQLDSTPTAKPPEVSAPDSDRNAGAVERKEPEDTLSTPTTIPTTSDREAAEEGAAGLRLRGAAPRPVVRDYDEIAKVVPPRLSGYREDGRRRWVDLAMIPSPPRIDPAADDDAIVALLLAAYRGCFEAVYGAKAFAQVGKYRQMLLAAGRLFRDEGVRPVEWVDWRFAQWAEMHEGSMIRPRLAFVFGRVGERLTRKVKRDRDEHVIETISDVARFKREQASHDQTTAFYGPKADRAARAQYRLHYAATRLDDDDLAATIEKVFPGGWRKHYDEAAAETEALQEEIDRRVARGDWIWANDSISRIVAAIVGARLDDSIEVAQDRPAKESTG